MADTEKTEEPTSKKRQEAADEGKIPKSQEVMTAVALLASAMILSYGAPSVASALAEIMGQGLVMAGDMGDGGRMLGWGISIGWRVLAITVGLGSGLWAVSAFVGGLQARGTWSAKPLGPNWSKINPMEGFSKVVGVQNVVELVKSLGKLGIVGYAIWVALRISWHDMMALPQQPPIALARTALHYSVKMLTIAGFSYLSLAAADYLYQWYQHEQNLKMSRQELKEELKMTEGNPMAKQRQRSLGRQRARRQMFKDVPTADVIIVNPTHRAIALKYDPSLASAPYVLALGERKIAERIKEIAKMAGVPIIENRPLAMALIKTSRVGSMIPAELYVAVAEILAFLLEQKKGHTRWMDSKGQG